MKSKYRIFAAICAAFILITGISAIADDFDLKNLVGKWEGEGMFLMPVTDVEVEIEGAGEFVWDEERQLIKTNMSGSKFLLAYSDSGLLIHHPETDSVSWEIWDSWGKHAKYWGRVHGDVLVADRVYKKRPYRVTVQFPHPDTLDFSLNIINPKDDESTEKASFLLWRVED